jgi:hypothetical protein
MFRVTAKKINYNINLPDRPVTSKKGRAHNHDTTVSLGFV